MPVKFLPQKGKQLPGLEGCKIYLEEQAGASLQDRAAITHLPGRACNPLPCPLVSLICHLPATASGAYRRRACENKTKPAGNCYLQARGRKAPGRHWKKATSTGGGKGERTLPALAAAEGWREGVVAATKLALAVRNWRGDRRRQSVTETPASRHLAKKERNCAEGGKTAALPLPLLPTAPTGEARNCWRREIPANATSRRGRQAACLLLLQGRWLWEAGGQAGREGRAGGGRQEDGTGSSARQPHHPEPLPFIIWAENFLWEGRQPACLPGGRACSAYILWPLPMSSGRTHCMPDLTSIYIWWQAGKAGL